MFATLDVNAKIQGAAGRRLWHDCVKAIARKLV